MIDFPQEDADFLTAMKKVRSDESVHKYPDFGGSLRLRLKSIDLREDFMLDIQRMSIQLKKNTFQNRARTCIILARLDIGGPPHRNPDGVEIPCPHIHLYKEGFDDKWAYALPDVFSNPNDSWTTLKEFMKFCNIVQAPHIEKRLFT